MRDAHGLCLSVACDVLGPASRRQVRLSCEKLSCVHLCRWCGKNKTTVGYARVLSLNHTADVTNSTVSLRRPCELRTVYTREYVESVVNEFHYNGHARIRADMCLWARNVHGPLYSVYTMQPVGQLVVSCIQRFKLLNNWLFNRWAVWQAKLRASCKRTFNRLSRRLNNQFDDRLYRVNGVWGTRTQYSKKAHYNTRKHVVTVTDDGENEVYSHWRVTIDDRYKAYVARDTWEVFGDNLRSRYNQQYHYIW